jgi:hypothetical protein
MNKFLEPPRIADEDQQATGHHAWERERQGHAPEGGEAISAEVFGRLDQTLVQAIQRYEKRENHQR